MVRATAWISSTITASTSDEELARARGQHQVERLRRRDQHVRTACAASPGARAAACRRCGCATRDVAADALERSAQVLLDVVRERLQRRDVDQPGPALSLGSGLGHQAVERPQECGERLARAGRGRHEHVLTARDRRPGLGLRLGGRSNERVNQSRTCGLNDASDSNSMQPTSVPRGWVRAQRNRPRGSGERQRLKGVSPADRQAVLDRAPNQCPKQDDLGKPGGPKPSPSMLSFAGSGARPD